MAKFIYTYGEKEKNTVKMMMAAHMISIDAKKEDFPNGLMMKLRKNSVGTIMENMIVFIRQRLKRIQTACMYMYLLMERQSIENYHPCLIR